MGDSMVPSTSTWLSSKPTWSHTHVSTSHWLLMLQSSPLRRLTTSSSPLPRSPTLASSQPTKWSSVIHDTVNTWPAACCPTPPPLPKHGLDLTTSSILCTPNVPSSTGTSVKVWKEVNSPKPVKIWPPSRRITKKSVSTPSKVKPKKAKTSTKHSAYSVQPTLIYSKLSLFQLFVISLAKAIGA